MTAAQRKNHFIKDGYDKQEIPGYERGKREINIPAKISLNENGIDFFMRNGRQITKLKDSADTESFGFILRSITPECIQRMIFLDYISTIELDIPDVSARRSEIIDCSKLITYGMLYKYLNTTTLNSMLGSKFVTQWNRSNPKNIIDKKTRLNETTLNRLIQDNPGLYNSIQNEILRPVVLSLRQAGDGRTEAERRNLILYCRKLMGSLSPFVWFILMTQRNKPEYPVFIGYVQRYLQDAVEKANIADYLAFMIIELLTKQESNNLHEYVQKKKGAVRAGDLQIQTPENRSKLLKEIEAQGIGTYVTWRIRSRNDTFGTNSLLHVSIYNRQSRFGDLEKKIMRHADIEVHERSLSDFYHEQDPSKRDSDLGLYYFAFLDEASRQVGIKFESFVNQVKSRDLTVMNLILKFL